MVLPKYASCRPVWWEGESSAGSKPEPKIGQTLTAPPPKKHVRKDPTRVRAATCVSSAGRVAECAGRCTSWSFRIEIWFCRVGYAGVFCVGRLFLPANVGRFPDADPTRKAPPSAPTTYPPPTDEPTTTVEQQCSSTYRSKPVLLHSSACSRVQQYVYGSSKPVPEIGPTPT